MLYAFFWTFLIVASLMIPILMLLHELTLRRFIFIGTVDLSSILMLFLTWNGYIRLASWALVVEIWLITTAYAATGSGMQDPVIVLYFIGVLIAGMILGQKAGLLAAGMSVFMELILVYLERRGLIAPDTIRHNTLSFFVSSTGAMIVIVVYQYLAVSSIRGSFERMYRAMRERQRAEDALRESEKRYRELSVTDGLTGLYNQRHFYQRLQGEMERAHRYDNPLSLILLDLDDFKKFNDGYGHLEGDKVLEKFAETILRCMRKTDSAFRYGGEEFIILLPETRSDQASVIAERIRHEFKTQLFYPCADGIPISKTVSIGIAEYKSAEDPITLIDRADKAMYSAKKKGKDQLCLS